jgi:phosphate transport system protein
VVGSAPRYSRTANEATSTGRLSWMRIKFHQALDELKVSLLSMAGMAEQAIQRAVEAYTQQDLALCETVILGDRAINASERQIYGKSVYLLATEQPTAVDLRFILAVLRMNVNLERVGDQAVHIARLGKDASGWPETDLPVDIPRLASLSAAMVSRSLRAFVEADEKLARSVLVLDDEVDELNRAASRDLTSAIQERPVITRQALNALLVSRNLERIGDHATNIAEDVIFWLSGYDVRDEVNLPLAS